MQLSYSSDISLCVFVSLCLCVCVCMCVCVCVCVCAYVVIWIFSIKAHQRVKEFYKAMGNEGKPLPLPLISLHLHLPLPLPLPLPLLRVVMVYNVVWLYSTWWPKYYFILSYPTLPCPVLSCPVLILLSVVRPRSLPFNFITVLFHFFRCQSDHFNHNVWTGTETVSDDVNATSLAILSSKFKTKMLTFEECKYSVV